MFYDQNMRLMVFAPKRPLQEVSPWLFQHSLLYRFFLRLTQGRDDQNKIAQEVQKNLLDLKTSLERDKIPFTVLMLPLMKPYSRWNQEDRARRVNHHPHLARGTYQILRPVHRDWKAPGTKGLTLQQTPGDEAHPNDRAGAILAAYLAEHHLLSN